MTTTIQIKAHGSSIYSEVAKKDFLGALEDCDSVNDIVIINGISYTLSTVILCDCDATPTVGTTTTSTVADVYTAEGVDGPVTLTTGLRVALNVNVTNAGASTVDFDGTGVKDIENDGAALTGDELQAGQRYPLVYDGTAFQLATNTSTAQSKFTIKGNIDCSANPNYPAAEIGDAYRVTVAGKIGGGAGKNVSIGDIVIAWANTASGTEGAVGVNWTVQQEDLDVATDAQTLAMTNDTEFISPLKLATGLQKGYNAYVTITSGVADDYVGDSAIAAKTVTVGSRYRVLIDANNTGGAATLKIGTAAAYPLLRNGSDPDTDTLVNGSAIIAVFTGAAFEIETTLRVSNSGGDDTLETSDKYQTITAAQTAAADGNRIVIEAGTYTDASLGKDGINYHFEKGAILNSTGRCFVDAGAAKTFAVTGSGRFTGTTGVIYTTAASNILFKCFYANGSGAAARTIWDFNGAATIVFEAETDLATTGQEQVIRQDGPNSSIYVKANRVIGYGGLVQTSGTSAGAKILIHAKEIIYLATNNGYVGVNLSAGSVELHGAVTFTGVGLYALPALYVIGTGSLKVFGDISSTNTDGVLECTAAGTVDFYGKITGNGKITNNGATVNFWKSVVNNYATFSAIIHVSGKTIVHSLVKNLDASATGHGVSVAAAGLILKQGASIYCTGAADSVYAGGAQNIKTYPGAVTNKALNVNITEVGGLGTIVVDADVDAE